MEYENSRSRRGERSRETTAATPVPGGSVVAAADAAAPSSNETVTTTPLTDEDVLDAQRRAKCDLILARGKPTTSEMLRSWPNETVKKVYGLIRNKKRKADLDGGTTEPPPLAKYRVRMYKNNQEKLFYEELKKLFNDQIGTDIILQFGNKQVMAHKAIVGARCRTLKQEIFKQEAGTSKQQQQNIGGDDDEEKKMICNLDHWNLGSEDGKDDDNDVGHKNDNDSNVPQSMIELCYGIVNTSDEKTNTKKSVNVVDHDDNNDNTIFGIRQGHDAMSADFESLYCSIRSSSRGSNEKYKDEKESETPNNDDFIIPCDLEIVGQDMTKDDSNGDSIIWKFELHSAVFCAHSKYGRSFLYHSPWTKKVSDDGSRMVLSLDASQFTYQEIQELVRACYTNSLSSIVAPIDHWFRLYNAAVYLGMEAIEKLIAYRMMMPTSSLEVLPDIAAFADNHAPGGAPELMDLWKALICVRASTWGNSPSDTKERHPSALARCFARLSLSRLESIFELEGMELEEEKILGLLVEWFELTVGSSQITDDHEVAVATLLRHVRLPFVPVGSRAMKKAIDLSIVSRDQLELCHMFQTDHEFRTSMLGTSTAYTPRTNHVNAVEVDRVLRRYKREMAKLNVRRRACWSL